MKLKVKSGYQVQEIAGENILITGGGDVDYSKMLVLNDSAAMLVRTLIEKELSVDSLVEVLTNTYAVDVEQAKQDVEDLLNGLNKQQVLEQVI